MKTLDPTEISEEIFVTQGLRVMVDQLEREMDQVPFLKLSTEIVQRIRWFQANALKYPAGPERARVFFRWLDAAIVADQARRPKAWKPVTCKVGCSACCHQMVEISADEGAVLAERVQSGISVDRDRLQRQLSKDDPGQWWRLAWKDSACVFLSKTGRCKVYEDRPLACRKYQVTSPASWCEPSPSGQAQGVAVLATLEAEIITTAALDLGKREGNIARALVSRLPAEGGGA